MTMMIKTLAVVALCALIGAAAAAAAAGDKPRSSPVAFSYSNCDSSNNKLNSATVSPYPIPTSDGSMVTASGSGTIGTEIDGALLRLTIEKEILGDYIKIPCVDGAGSCTYDFCTLFQNNTACPPPLPADFECSCPFKPATLTLPDTSFAIPAIPSTLKWLTNGNYKLTAALQSFAGADVGCVNIALALSD